jgi:hypothetical protein
VQLLVFVVSAVVVVAIFSVPWLVLRWARRACPAPRPPLQSLILGLAATGVVTTTAVPVVTVVLLIGSFSAVADADSTTKATQLARGISTAMNCGAFGTLLGCVISLLAGLLLLWQVRVRPG